MTDEPGIPSRFKRALSRSDRPMQSARETLPGPPALQPSGDMKASGKWGSFQIPAVVLTGLLSLLGGKAWDSTRSTEIRSDIRELAQETRDARDADRAAIRTLRQQLDEEHQYTKRDIPILAKVIERQNPSAKLVWDQGWQPDVDFEPAPLGGSAPKVQPSLALVRPPVWTP